MTRNGVETDFTKTPYIVDTAKWTFYFSSQYYQNMFMEKREKYINDYNQRLLKYTGFNISLPEIGELKCYLAVEKRGCRAYYKPNFQFLSKEVKLLID